jgi:DNA transformation protein and related proteins
MTDVSDMKNLGPVTRNILKSIGINTAEELKSKEAVDVYVEMKLNGYNVTRNMLWGLYGAINDLDWRDIPDEKKVELESTVEDMESNRDDQSLF